MVSDLAFKFPVLPVLYVIFLGQVSSLLCALGFVFNKMGRVLGSVESLRALGGIKEKVTTKSWITVGDPQMCLGLPRLWLLEFFPWKIWDSLQELSLANVFQICTWPPSHGPHSPYHFHGGVRDPCQNFPFPSRASLLPTQLSALRSEP